MYGIFMESVVIFQNYWGRGLMFILFALAFFYLWFTEEDKLLRGIFLYTPLTLLVLFFFPIFRKVFVRLMDDGSAYYRVLWLIPFSMIIAYAAVKLSASLGEKKGAWLKNLVLVISAAAIVICGKYVYHSPYMSKAENLYHLPKEVIEICDMIAPKEGEERIWAVFPTDMVYFVRQYNTNIQMPYGRDMVEPVWDYYNEVHEIMNHPETIDLEKLLEASRKKHCAYVILPKTKDVLGEPEALGLSLLGIVDGYQVYRDESVALAKDGETDTDRLLSTSWKNVP